MKVPFFFNILVAATLLLASKTSAFVRLPPVTTRPDIITWKTTSRRYFWRSPEKNRVKEDSAPLVPDTRQSPQQTTSLLVKLAFSPLGALIVLAGIVLFHESGHYLAARSFGVHPEEFSVGFGPKLLSGRLFGDEFNLRAIPFGGYVSLDPALIQVLPWQQRLLILSAGIIFNLFLAFFIYMCQILLGQGLEKLVFDQGVVVNAIAGPDAAASGKLRPGDVILSVNGNSLTNNKSPSSEIEAQKAISDLIATVQATPNGDSVQFSVQRGSRNIQVSIRPKRVASEPGGELGPPTIGVLLAPNLVGVESLQTDSVTEASCLASNRVLTVTQETANGFITLVRDFFSRKESDYRVRGPLGVIETASEVVATQDWNTIVSYAAALSINLAVINTVPIPPSDGFQLVALLAEAVRNSFSLQQ